MLPSNAAVTFAAGQRGRQGRHHGLSTDPGSSFRTLSAATSSLEGIHENAASDPGDVGLGIARRIEEGIPLAAAAPTMVRLCFELVRVRVSEPASRGG
jgi:hypothetical protein